MSATRATATFALFVAVTTAGCGDERESALIGWTVGSSAVRRVAQAVIDSTHRQEWPRIAVTTLPGPAVSRLARDPVLVRFVDLATRLAAAPQVVGVVGPAGSREAMLAGPIYRDVGLPFVMPTANAPRLGALGPLAVRVAVSVEDEGGFIADFATRQLRATSAVIFYAPDEWGTGLQEAVARSLWFHGVRVARPVPVTTLGCSEGTNDLEAPTVATLRREQPDVVVLASRTRESMCILKAAADELPGVPFVAGDGTVLQPSMPPAGRPFYAVAFWTPELETPESRSFLDLFRRIVGRDPTNDEAMTFDAAMLLVQAIREVGADRGAVAAYLARFGGSTPPYRGVTGPIGGDATRHRRLHMVDIERQSRMQGTVRDPVAPVRNVAAR